MKARYFQRGESIDYTPQTDIEAGMPVFLGQLAGVTKLDIGAGQLGAIAVVGVYSVVKDSSAFTAGVPVYWNETSQQATATPTAKYLGLAVEAAATGDETVKVLLNAGQSAYDASKESSNSGN